MSTGLLESLRNLASTLVSILQTRLLLLSNDLEEEKLRLFSVLVYGAAALFITALGVLLAVLWVVAAFWDTHRMLVMGIVTGLFLGGGLLFLALLFLRVKRAPKPFAATLAELAKDRERLGGRK